MILYIEDSSLNDAAVKFYYKLPTLFKIVWSKIAPYLQVIVYITIELFLMTKLTDKC